MSRTSPIRFARVLGLVTPLIGCGAGSSAAPAKSSARSASDATPEDTTVSVPMFGTHPIADGEVLLMDGGTHGVQGHTLRIPASGTTTWVRSVGSVAPSGAEGEGTLELGTDETAMLRASVEELWDLAASGRAAFNLPLAQGAPRWVWAIVVRRGNEVRMLHGGNMASPLGAPDAARPVLQFLTARVDAASAAPR